MKAFLVAAIAAGVATATIAADVAPAAVAEPLWKSTIAAGANVSRGNSEAMLYNGSVVSAFKEGPNEARVGIEANYGEARTTQGAGTNATTTTAANVNNGVVFAEYRYLLTERNYVYGKAELLEDVIANVDYRATIGPGVGRYFLMSPDQKLSAELGATYIAGKQAGKVDDTVALRVSERYELKLSATASLWESVEYLPSVDDFSRYLLNAEAGLEAAVNTKLSLRIVVQDKFNSSPAPGKDDNDVVLIAGLSYKL
jgi:putative salt-induced outer membrane protein YdiY